MTHSLTMNRLSPIGAIPLPSAGRLASIAAAFGLGLLSFAMTDGASAQQPRPEWEDACSYKQPNTSGNGMAVVGAMCANLRFCQSMAEQHRPGMVAMGCYGFTPMQQQQPQQPVRKH